MASADDREAAKLWRVNRTVKEMAVDRVSTYTCCPDQGSMLLGRSGAANWSPRQVTAWLERGLIRDRAT